MIVRFAIKIVILTFVGSAIWLLIFKPIDRYIDSMSSAPGRAMSHMSPPNAQIGQEGQYAERLVNLLAASELFQREWTYGLPGKRSNSAALMQSSINGKVNRFCENSQSSTAM